MRARPPGPPAPATGPGRGAGVAAAGGGPESGRLPPVFGRGPGGTRCGVAWPRDAPRALRRR
eukprot:1348644-Alexandrium_andersonii.AAC.1